VKNPQVLARPANELLSLAKAWGPPLLVSLVILVLAGDLGAGKYTLKLMQWLQTQPYLLRLVPDAEFHTCLRKVAHLVVYSALSFYFLRAMLMHRPTSRKRPVLWVVVICLSVALLDEGRQSTIPSRVASMMDVILDTTAAAICAGCAVILYQPAPIRSGPWRGKTPPG